MSDDMILQVSVGQMLAFGGGAVTLISGVIWWLGRTLVGQVLTGVSSQIKGLDDRLSELEREIESLRRELPLEYVLREDWIRFSSSMDHKLDRLNDKLSQLLMGQAQVGKP